MWMARYGSHNTVTGCVSLDMLLVGKIFQMEVLWDDLLAICSPYQSQALTEHSNILFEK
jgi:hypothetical protein